MTIHQFTNILIVDDSVAVRGVVRKLLTQLGFKNLDEASDGKSSPGKNIDLAFWFGDLRLEHGADERATAS